MASVTQTSRQVEDNYRLLISWLYSKVEFLGFPSLKDDRPLRLEDIYVPLSLKRSYEPDAERMYVPAALEQSRQIVVLGDPASGKSTLIKVLAYQFGRIEPAPLARRLGPHVPVPIILRDYDVSQWTTWRDMLAAFVAQLPSDRPPEVTPDWLAEILQEGRGILLLDGLDEVGPADTRKGLRDRVILPMLDQTGKNLAVLTSRIVGYEEVSFDSQMPIRLPESAGESTLRRMQRFYAAPFDKSEIREFVTRWYAVRETDQRVREGGVRSLLDAISRNQRIGALAANPGLLTLMALVHRVTATLPSGRVKLYDKIVEAYLETIDLQRKLPRFDASLDQMKRWLARIGWEMQLRRREESAALRAPRREVLEWLTQAVGSDRPSAKETAEEFLNYVANRSGLLIPVSPTEFGFAHLSIQEYFAAWYLRGLIRKFDDLTKHCAAHMGEPWWHETLTLLFSMLSEFSGAGDDLVEALEPQSTRFEAASFFAQLLVEEENGLQRGNQIAARIAVDAALARWSSALELGHASRDRYRRFIKPELDRKLDAGPERQPDRFILGWREFAHRQEENWDAELLRYVERWSDARWKSRQIRWVVWLATPSAHLFQWLLAHAPLEAFADRGYRWLHFLLRERISPRARALAEVAAAGLCSQILKMRLRHAPSIDPSRVQDLNRAPQSLARSVALAALGDEDELQTLQRTVPTGSDWEKLLGTAALLAAGKGTPAISSEFQSLTEKLAGRKSHFPPYLADEGPAALNIFDWILRTQDFEPSSPDYARMTMPVSELLKQSE